MRPHRAPPDPLHPQDLSPAPNARAAAMWRRYLRFWGPRVEADVDDELEFHRDMRVHDCMTRGMTEAEARDAVQRRLGDLAAVRSECLAIDHRRHRRMNRTALFDALAQDVRFGVRTLLRQKGWTIVGILTLALGIGANTAMFSVINTLVLHPLAYPHADRLAVVFLQPTENAVSGVSVYLTPDGKLARDWQQGTHAFEDLEGFSSGDLILRRGTEQAAVVKGASVQPGFAAFAGQRPLVGRYFTAQDVESRAMVAVLGEGIWRSRYGGKRDVIGQPVSLNGKLYTIIGVMPAAFQLPAVLQSYTDVFLPLDLDAGNVGVTLVGRLRPGVTYGQAARDLDTLSMHRPGAPSKMRFAATVTPPSGLIHFQDTLKLLMAAVMMVLIIACANVAHLLLARGAARQREMAIRAAMGAGRWRMFRQLITESLVLATSGGLLGLAVGWGTLRALVALRPPSLSQLSTAHMDGRTLLVAAGLVAVTGLLFGLVGASQSARLASPQVLKVGVPTSLGPAHDRLRSLLVITEMALSTALLVGAMLLVRSVGNLQMTDPGFRTAGLYGVSANLQATSDTTSERRWSFYQRMAEQARRLPGVESVTLATASPPGRSFSIGNLQIDDQPAPEGGSSFVSVLGVHPDYFAFMGMRILQGTTFTDTTSAAAQVVINEGMARKYWPGTSPIGHRVRVEMGGNGNWLTVVGVVNDAATGGLTMQTSDPILYQAPQPFFSPVLMARVSKPETALPALRRLFQQTNAAIPPVQLDNITDAMMSTIALLRFTMRLLAMFTLLAIVLAAVGLYGVMAYAVTQRTREIGIRMALGATTANIARSVIGRGVALGAVGMVLGLVGAHWGTQLLTKMLAGVTTKDPLSFTMAGLVLLATAVLACVTPMRRAMRVEPAVAMKAE